MKYLIDTAAQNDIAQHIELASKQVLNQLPNHGNEEGLTVALGKSLIEQSFTKSNLKVEFQYRQHNRITEEKNSGADGSFLIRIQTPTITVEKAALFQAKLILGLGNLRDLTLSNNDTYRLMRQTQSMLRFTSEAIALFYTHRNIYAIDAAVFSRGSLANRPFSTNHRFITLGTYLGKWVPRCSKGDQNTELVTRSKHMDGFKYGIDLNIVLNRPSTQWGLDKSEDAWRKK
jgi:hypothetical protein